MKNLRFLPATLMVIVLLSACTQTDLSTMSVADAQGVIPGTYKVSYYEAQGGTLNAFEGYTFVFYSNGTMNATNGIDSYDGTWMIQYISTDVAYDKEVMIAINGNPEMEALDQSWYVKDVTDVTLQLTDDGDATEVHFIKI